MVLSAIFPYLASTGASFLLAFGKGLQSRNIVNGHHKAAFLTSFFITSCEVVTISLVVKSGWSVLLTAGLGGALGIVSSMYAHGLFFKPEAAGAAGE